MTTRHTFADIDFESRTPDEVALLKRLATFARVMDHAYEIPGLKVKFGWDAILGLIPGVGDVVSNVLAAYLVVEAQRLGLSRWDSARMIGNILIDAAISSVPLAGDIFDVFWRANDRNMAILHAHLKHRGRIIEGEARQIPD
jgi:hypothetical protein